jgi:hypothetical protein
VRAADTRTLWPDGPMPSLPECQAGKVGQRTTERHQPLSLSVPEADFATEVREGGCYADLPIMRSRRLAVSCPSFFQAGNR